MEWFGPHGQNSAGENIFSMGKSWIKPDKAVFCVRNVRINFFMLLKRGKTLRLFGSRHLVGPPKMIFDRKQAATVEAEEVK